MSCFIWRCSRPGVFPWRTGDCDGLVSRQDGSPELHLQTRHAALGIVRLLGKLISDSRGKILDFAAQQAVRESLAVLDLAYTVIQ